MNQFLSGIFGNDSAFGKLMTRIGIIIGANLMFVIFSIPVITIGASLTGLYTVMFKTLRGEGVLNPFKVFLQGFKTNFKQATLCWVALLVIAAIGYADLKICAAAPGIIANIRYVIYAVAVALLIGAIYLFPVMSAFDNKLLFLFRTGYYFALRTPLKLIAIVLLHVVPLAITYLDQSFQPLYVFLWFFIGFGAIAMASASLLLPEFRPFLPLLDQYGEFVLDEHGNQIKTGDSVVQVGGQEEKSEKEILDEMKRLDM